ncbi:hypothetical protein ACIBL3_21445 [Kribbella sp. NPDC050124]|uniref:hypothetical protein n=1 Tax=Kribbella sp. NPDC050124 TaxID=3364114 RepID=UPI0037960BBC
MPARDRGSSVGSTTDESEKRMRRTPATALVVALILATAACGGDQEEGAEDRAATVSAKPSPSPQPKPTPAISTRGAQDALKRYLSSISQANAKLDPARAAKIETGSALQIHSAQYRVYRKNDLRYLPVKYVGAVGAAPLSAGYPKWFFTAATDRGSEPATRDFLLFVQARSGAPWHVTYAPFSNRATGALAPGVDVADFPAVVAPGDTRLQTPPGKVAAVLADAVTRGGKSPSARLFAQDDNFKTVRGKIVDNRSAYTDNDWAGTSRAVAAPTPVYAVRTKSGGALVWFGLDLLHSYRNDGDTNMVWDTESAGDMQRGFGLPSEVTSSITRQERYELVAYIPPKGKGSIRLVASRWFPLSVRGR